MDINTINTLVNVGLFSKLNTIGDESSAWQNFVFKLETNAAFITLLLLIFIVLHGGVADILVINVWINNHF